MDWIKFLLSSGPVAWLVICFGVIAWGLKLEHRIDRAKELIDGVKDTLGVALADLKSTDSGMAKDLSLIKELTTRMDERLSNIVKRLDGK